MPPTRSGVPAASRTLAAAAPARAGAVRPVWPLLAAAVTVLLWASAFVVIRWAGAAYPPGAMALGRMVLAAVVLGLMVLLRRNRQNGRNRRNRQNGTPERRPVLPRGRPLALVVGCGALWFGAYVVAVNAAEQRLDAGTTALLVNVAPLLIAVLAALLLGEGFPRSLAVGLAIAFAGVAVIAAASSVRRTDPTGLLLALAAAGLYAVAVLLQKPALKVVDPLTATWLGALVGAAVCLPYAPELARTLATAPPSATLAVAYLGVFPTAIAFTTWAYALAHTSAGRLSASTYLVPALTVLLSWAFLAEAPAPLALAGGALCLAGVAVTRLPRRRPHGLRSSPDDANR